MNNTRQQSAPSSHHPLNIIIKPDEQERLRADLVVPLANGLMDAGAVFRHVRQGRPYRRGARYEFILDGEDCALRLATYGALRWVWRLTVSPPWGNHPVNYHHELTFDIEEMDADGARSRGDAAVPGRRSETRVAVVRPRPIVPALCVDEALREPL